MLYSGREQDVRRDEPSRTAHEERRTFARRIDCDSQARPAVQYAPARGGAPRDSEAWERSRRGYGR